MNQPGGPVSGTTSVVDHIETGGATPRRLTGVWRRASLSIDGGPAHEPGIVLWFQVGDTYLDVRSAQEPSPLTGPGVFAGTTRWNAPSLTWVHELDSLHTVAGPAPDTDPPAPGTAATDIDADAGVLSWDDDLLTERGTFTTGGRTIDYVEVWERVTPPGAPAGALAGGSYRCDGGARRAARIGDYRGAITVDPREGLWAGVIERHTARGWAVEVTAGDEFLASAMRADPPPETAAI